MAPVLSLGFSLPGEPGGDDPPDADDVLVAEVLGLAASGAALGAGLEDDLGQAVAVAEVDEDQAAVVATGVDPAVEDHLLADVVAGQLAAGLGPFEHGRRWISRLGKGLRRAGIGVHLNPRR